MKTRPYRALAMGVLVYQLDYLIEGLCDRVNYSDLNLGNPKSRFIIEVKVFDASTSEELSGHAQSILLPSWEEEE